MNRIKVRFFRFNVGDIVRIVVIKTFFDKFYRGIFIKEVF